MAVLAQSVGSAYALNSSSWRQAAITDIATAYRLYRDNHPGMYDRRDPHFRSRLAKARDKALILAGRADSYGRYVDALGAFSAELSDGHARLVAKLEPAEDGPSAWPGFVAAWRGDRLFVHYALTDTLIPVGSEILGCDGRPISTVIRHRLALRGFRVGDAGHWWARSSQAFVSSPASDRDRPRRCAFRLADGATATQELKWRPAPSELSARVSAAEEGERTPIGITEPRKGLFLVGLPDFNPDAEGVAAYKTLNEEIRRLRPRLLRARAIIVDLRHNDGGSSEWGRQVADSLFGAAAVDDAISRYFQRTTVWWRASAGNINYLAKLETQYRKDGANRDADEVSHTRHGMQAAMKNGRRFFVTAVDQAAPSGPRQHSDLRARVYVITPGGCASACLDAVDIFTRFPNVRLIGAPTASDTNYLDARAVDLPSGHAFAVIPNKMWVDRPRRSREYYVPRIEVRDLNWSTKTFLARVEDDLSRNKRR